MLERLDYVRVTPRRILDAGAGTGRDLRALASRYPGAATCALDFSTGMLRTMLGARGVFSRMLGRGPLAVCGEMERMPFAHGAFDLAWSNLALHRVDEPDAVLREFARVLKAEGLLMFSTYGPDSFRELRAIASTRVPAFVDMHDLGDLLVGAGFADPVMDMERITLTYADAAAFFDDLRATAQAQPAWQGLGGRRRIAAVAGALDAQRAGGRLSVSFEIVYGHAWKGVPKRTAEGHAIVRADFPKRPLR